MVTDNFHKTIGGEIDNIATQFNSQRKKECEENRVAIKSIIETLVLCEELEIIFRGNDDSGVHYL